MKFLHTADWQIGMRAAHAASASGRVRDERLAAAERVVQTACDHDVDFILLAGDTFEDNGVDRALVQRIALTLADFGRPVYILPGNHDPLVPGSVWHHRSWTDCDRLHVCDKNEPIDLPGARLYPCPALKKHSPDDPTAWIDAHDEQAIAIGLAHGSVQAIPQESPDFPIPPDAAVRSGLDYLALGHWHSTDTDSYERMAYSGAHEPTAFEERDSGNVLVVEIADRRATPQVTSVPTGRLNWLVRDESIRAPGDLTRLRRSIEAIDNPQNTLLRISLRGVLHADEQEELKHIDDYLAARGFLFKSIDPSGLLPMSQDDHWLADLPSGPIRETAHRLQRWADPTTTDGRPDGVSPEVAARALVELFALHRGGCS